MKFRTTIREHYILNRCTKFVFKKRLIIPTVGKDVKQLKFLHAAVGSVKIIQSILENSLAESLKLKHTPTT